MINELLKIIDRVSIDELGMRTKFEEEIGRFNKFQGAMFGNEKQNLKKKDIDIRAYAKYLLKEGSSTERRELLGNLRSRLVYKDKSVTLITE